MKTLAKKASISLGAIGIGMIVLGALLFHEDTAIISGGILFIGAVVVMAFSASK